MESSGRHLEYWDWLNYKNLRGILPFSATNLIRRSSYLRDFHTALLLNEVQVIQSLKVTYAVAANHRYTAKITPSMLHIPIEGLTFKLRNVCTTILCNLRIDARSTKSAQNAISRIIYSSRKKQNKKRYADNSTNLVSQIWMWESDGAMELIQLVSCEHWFRTTPGEDSSGVAAEILFCSWCQSSGLQADWRNLPSVMWK